MIMKFQWANVVNKKHTKRYNRLKNGLDMACFCGCETYEKHDDGLGFKNHLGIPYVINQYLAYAEKEGLMPKITSVKSIIGLFGEENK